MARTTRRVNKKQNVKIRQQKTENKSKYFKNARDNSAKRIVKHIGKQAPSESGKDEKNAPNLAALCTLNGSITSCNLAVFGQRLGRDFFDIPTETLAVALLGKIVCRKTEQGDLLCGKITETEAYLGEIDRACHAYGGKRTARNAPMYGPPGTAYVYFIYGMYHCFNISSKESGACVLIRALEPLAGETEVVSMRGVGVPSTPTPPPCSMLMSCGTHLIRLFQGTLLLSDSKNFFSGGNHSETNQSILPSLMDSIFRSCRNEAVSHCQTQSSLKTSERP